MHAGGDAERDEEVKRSVHLQGMPLGTGTGTVMRMGMEREMQGRIPIYTLSHISSKMLILALNLSTLVGDASGCRRSNGRGTFDVDCGGREVVVREMGYLLHCILYPHQHLHPHPPIPSPIH